MEHRVAALSFGPKTAYSDGTLTVDLAEAQAAMSSPALASVSLTCLSPASSARIVKVLDAVEPRAKAEGQPGIFPGFLSPALPSGRGETHVLAGMAVVAAGYLPRAQEAVVDMSGPGAHLSPLGCTHNLVAGFEPADGASWEEVEAALRMGVLRLSNLLATAAVSAPPTGTADLRSPPRNGGGDLPRVGVITNVQTQGAFKDVFVYGRSFAGSLPTALDPRELEDGAVVSGQYGHPGLKNPTYLYQNHPVVAALRAQDGTDLSFAGLILSPEPVEQRLKEMVSAHAARLCAALGFDAVIVTKEGGGNADADMALKMDACEDLGITAVGIFAEMSGPEGTGPPVVAPPEHASAMISTGNYDEKVMLPEVELAVGGATFDLTGDTASAELQVPVAVLYGSLSPLGWGRLSAGV